MGELDAKGAELRMEREVNHGPGNSERESELRRGVFLSVLLIVPKALGNLLWSCCCHQIC